MTSRLSACSTKIKKSKIFFFLLLFFSSLFAQRQENPLKLHEVGNSKKEIVRFINEQAGYKFCYHDFVLATLNRFEGVKYGSGAKGCSADQLLINTASFDCVTFIENFLAMAFTTYELRNNPFAFEDEIFKTFSKYLMIIRYYENQPTESWENRINYYTEQLFKLTDLGLLIHIGENSGAKLYTKKINYISSNKYKFPGIKNWKKLKQTEKKLTERPKFYFPLDEIEKCYKPIAQEGDIVALTTTIDGLEVSHTGIITLKNGRLFFSHASQKHKKLIMEEDFLEYLDTRSTITGIMIFRPVFH